MTQSETAAPKRPRSGAHGSSRKSTGGRKFVRDVVIIFLAAILISFGVKTFLVRSFYIPSGSMENTLQINDRIVVDELAGKVTQLHRGDVIVFTDPGGWLTPADTAAATPASTNPVIHGIQTALTAIGLGTADSDDHLIKRIIGLPGDKVSCCSASGLTSVNGVALTEPYTKDSPATSAVTGNYKPFSVTVPKGELWVEGDNRNDSEDSRFHQDLPTGGFVPISDVVGRAVVITWPASRWTWLGGYPGVFTSVGGVSGAKR